MENRDFSKSINKRGENINTGRKIKEIFINFRENIELINPFNVESYTDEYINNAILNYDGNHMSFNVFPIEVLECCLKDNVKKPIQSLLSPSYKCLESIHLEINEMINNLLENESIARFTELTKIIKEEINKLLNNNIIPTNNQIKDKILIEENYIWTDNVDFLNKLTDIIKNNNSNTLNPSLIRTLLIAYFKTIISSISDQIPKIIMYYFINNTEKDIYIELFKNISSYDINTLLLESSEISNKRKELSIQKNNIDSAIKLIQSF